MIKRKSTLNSSEQLARGRHRNLRQLLVRATRAMNHSIFAKLISAGYTDIKMSHNAVFENLDESGSSVSLLAERAGMTKQSMSVILQDLQEKGYVLNEFDPADGRARIIRFTERGWKLMVHVFEIIREIELACKKQLAQGNFEVLCRSLDKLSHGEISS